MRPALKPGLLLLWRNRDTLQVGIDPRRAIALTGMRGAAGLLTLLDGSRDRSQVMEAAESLGIAERAADRVLTLLAAGGALDDVPAHACRGQSAAARSRLAPELATAALAHGDGDGGARTLARRQSARVQVHGASRVGLPIASLLTAAGVGQVVCTGPIQREWHDPHPDSAYPDGPHPDGRHPDGPRPNGWSGAGRLADGDPEPTPHCQHHRQPAGPRPDLVVLADHYDRDLPAALVAERIPHLAAGGAEAIGVVGPLVTPGRSACLRCLDLARTERDPAWPLILAQLAGRTADPPACDAVLATATAAQAARLVLTYLDRSAAPMAVTNGTIELVLPDWQWRRRSWRPHPACGCGSRSGS